MNYEEFIMVMQAEVDDMFGGSMLVERQDIVKNNGVEKVGLSLRKEGENAAPIIYLEEFYERYCTGEQLEDLADELIRRVQNAFFIPEVEWQEFLKFENMKSQIVYKLVNTQKNQKLLKQVPNLPILDFSILFCVMIPVNETEYYSFLIRNEHINEWKIPISILYQYAKENTPRLCPYKLKSLTEFVEEDLGMPLPESELVVLTNNYGRNGASAILYPKMPEKISQYVGGNYYLLPSSIHEFLIVPEMDDMMPEYLREMVRDVNRQCVEENEFLSDDIYYFNGNIITKM